MRGLRYFKCGELWEVYLPPLCKTGLSSRGMKHVMFCHEKGEAQRVVCLLNELLPMLTKSQKEAFFKMTSDPDSKYCNSRNWPEPESPFPPALRPT